MNEIELYTDSYNLKLNGYDMVHNINTNHIMISFNNKSYII